METTKLLVISFIYIFFFRRRERIRRILENVSQSLTALFNIQSIN